MSDSKVIILKNNISAIRGAISGEGLKKAVLAGGHVIEGNAKINVRETFSSKMVGALANSIQVVLSKATETSAEADIGPTVIYGRIQELGGIVKPVTAKMLSWIDNGIRVFAHLVQIPARPYMRPAVDEHIEQIGEAVSYQIRKDIEKAAK
jgi:phage gpG-like protein